MSTHSVNVVRLGAVEPHPNADKLEVTSITGYTAVLPKGMYKEGDLVTYIEPDYVVPESPQFAFLGTRPKDRRIGVKKLHGMWSEGLVVPAPEGAVEGENVMEKLGIVRWEPPEPGQPGWMGVKGPPLGCLESVPDFIKIIPKYDLENLKKYSDRFEPGEMVHVTEKLHGPNARYVWHDGRMFCGSRTQWRKPEPTNVYWETLKQNPGIEMWCMDNPNIVVCGEIYGAVQDLRYGAKDGEYRFAAFDLWDPSQLWWLSPPEDGNFFETVPHLATIEFDLQGLKDMAECDSVYGGIREGLVIQPVKERYDNKLGRIKMKLVSNRYLSR